MNIPTANDSFASSPTGTRRFDRRAFSALAALAALGVLRCSSARYDDPTNPGPWRLTTQPTGARVYLPAFKLELSTPCHLPLGVDRGTEIEISLAGYQSFQGRIRDLTQIAANSFELVLTR